MVWTKTIVVTRQESKFKDLENSNYLDIGGKDSGGIKTGY